MKPASLELLALLETRQFYVADLYTFTLAGGGVLRYCSGDQTVMANGFTYSAGGTTGPYFDRQDNKAKCHWKIGVEVDTLVFDVLPGTATVLGEPFLQAVHAGQFDGAEVVLERAFMPSYGDTSRGTIVYFVGRVAEIDAGRSIATFSVNSHLELLNLQLPRNLFQSGCVNNLGDAACGVSLASYGVAGSVTSVANAANSVSATTVGGQAAGYFQLGKIRFTSGGNAGLTRSIASYDQTNGALVFVSPFPVAPAQGDAFQIFPGCDKTYSGSNGCPKFNNVARFKGFPFVPVPETAV